MFRKFWLPILVVAGMLVYIHLVTNSAFWLMFDLPALLIMLVLAPLPSCLIHGAGNIGPAFKAPFAANPSRRDLQTAIAFFQALCGSVFGFAACAAIISLVSMMRNLEDPTQVGPNLAIAMLSLFYAAVIHVLLVLPFIINARKRLAELD